MLKRLAGLLFIRSGIRGRPISLTEALRTVAQYRLSDQDGEEMWLVGKGVRIRLFKLEAYVQILCLDSSEWDRLEEGQSTTAPVPYYVIIGKNEISCHTMTGNFHIDDDEYLVEFEQPTPVNQVYRAHKDSLVPVEDAEILNLITLIASMATLEDFLQEHPD
jgi:hypothetical protein